MACLKRLLPAGYSGYSQIPAQSRSRSLPWWSKPPPVPDALLQTFINPLVLRLLKLWTWHVGLFNVHIYMNLVVGGIKLPYLLWLPPQSPPWLGGGARGWAVQSGLGWKCNEGMDQHGEQGWKSSPATTTPQDPPENWGRIQPLLRSSLSQGWARLQRWRDLALERPLPQSAFEWHS